MTGRKGGSAQARAQGQEPKALFPLLALLPEALEESALVFRGGTHRLGFEGVTQPLGRLSLLGRELLGHGRAEMQIHFALSEPARWDGDERLNRTAIVYVTPASV